MTLRACEAIPEVPERDYAPRDTTQGELFTGRHYNRGLGKGIETNEVRKEKTRSEAHPQISGGVVTGLQKESSGQECYRTSEI